MAATEGILPRSGNRKRARIHKQATSHLFLGKEHLFIKALFRRYLASNDSHKELLKKILLSEDDSTGGDAEVESGRRRRGRRREPPSRFFDRRRSNAANAN